MEYDEDDTIELKVIKQETQAIEGITGTNTPNVNVDTSSDVEYATRHGGETTTSLPITTDILSQEQQSTKGGLSMNWKTPLLFIVVCVLAVGMLFASYYVGYNGAFDTARNGYSHIIQNRYNVGYRRGYQCAKSGGMLVNYKCVTSTPTP